MSKQGCVPGTDIYAEDCCVDCSTCWQGDDHPDNCECNCAYCLCECTAPLPEKYRPYREAWLGGIRDGRR